MPTVSVVIPTCDRPEMLKRAIESVLAQTYRDWELVVVDDSRGRSAEDVMKSYDDTRIRYVAHGERRGGSAARNTGIRESSGEYVAFLDDDDEWLAPKLEVQMAELANSPEDVAFSFSAVINQFDDHAETTQVSSGVADYAELSLASSKNFLTVTLIIRRSVLQEVGGFDESLPSHQETDLVIRIAHRHRGLGVNTPLVRVNMKSGYERTGGDLSRRIAGREMVLDKHRALFSRFPEYYAFQLFRLGLLYRARRDYGQARSAFRRAWRVDFRIRYLLHCASMVANGAPYRMLRRHE